MGIMRQVIKIIIAGLLLLIAASIAMPFSSKRAAQANNSIIAKPVRAYGDWKNTNAITERDLTPKDNFSKFNPDNSAYPLHIPQKPAPDAKPANESGQPTAVAPETASSSSSTASSTLTESPTLSLPIIPLPSTTVEISAPVPTTTATSPSNTPATDKTDKKSTTTTETAIASGADIPSTIAATSTASQTPSTSIATATTTSQDTTTSTSSGVSVVATTTTSTAQSTSTTSQSTSSAISTTTQDTSAPTTTTDSTPTQDTPSTSLAVPLTTTEQPSVKQPKIKEGEAEYSASIFVSGFSVNTDFYTVGDLTQVEQTQLVLSLAAKEVAGQYLIVSYGDGENWTKLKTLSLKKKISNDDNNSFAYIPLEHLTTVGKIRETKIKITYIN